MKFLSNKKLAWWLVIGWMGFIFFMSQQPGNESTKQSNFVIHVLSYLGINLNDYLGSLTTLIVRKLAHFTEYMILFFLVFNLLKFYIKNRCIFVLAISIVFIYACSDEFHQLFVKGRAGQFRDVLIDTSGGCFGAIIIYLKNKFKNFKSRKKNLFTS